MSAFDLAKRAVLMLAAAGLAVAVAFAQGGGGRPPGGGGGGQGGGGGTGLMPSVTRAGMLASTLKLDDAQKKDAKAVLDEAYKAAAPLRTSLMTARQALGAAVLAADEAKIDQAIVAYASEVTSMATGEAQALATIVRGLKPDQVDATAVQTAASLMRGAFVGKKWDTAPDTQFY